MPFESSLNSPRPGLDLRDEVEVGAGLARLRMGFLEEDNDSDWHLIEELEPLPPAASSRIVAGHVLH